MNEIKIGDRKIGEKYPIFVIAEAGINHNGSFSIAKKLVNMAKKAGADCIKFQTHIVEEEMTKTKILPGKISKTPLWDIIKKCQLTDIETIYKGIMRLFFQN